MKLDYFVRRSPEGKYYWRCIAFTLKGEQCKAAAQKGRNFCGSHLRVPLLVKGRTVALGYKDGYESGKEDFAIRAPFGVPDETLGSEYRAGYIAGWEEAREKSDLPPNWEEAALAGIAEREDREAVDILARKLAKGAHFKPQRVILKIECVDGALAQIDFLDDIDVATALIATAIRTGNFPAVKWDLADGVTNFQSYPLAGPFKKMEIIFS